MSADVLWKMIVILSELRIAQLCSSNEGTLILEKKVRLTMILLFLIQA